MTRMAKDILRFVPFVGCVKLEPAWEVFWIILRKIVLLSRIRRLHYIPFPRLKYTVDIERYCRSHYCEKNGWLEDGFAGKIPITFFNYCFQSVANRYNLNSVEYHSTNRLNLELFEICPDCTPFQSNSVNTY